jgi:hypothetical protein
MWRAGLLQALLHQAPFAMKVVHPGNPAQRRVAARRCAAASPDRTGRNARLMPHDCFPLVQR